MEGELRTEPLEHSVRDVHLDSQARQGELNSEPLEHSVPDRAPWRGAVLCDRLTMSDPLEHSVSVGPPQGGEEISSEEDTKVHPQPACVPRDASESQREEVPLLEDQPETAGSRSETGEAVVVGAIGSAAPWFLTGWAHEVEIDSMIDMGCQVTNLSTMVFERMCMLDPRVHSKLRPCRRRLVSADSSPLMVQGQLELSIVFPGVCWDMLFVVANIGSDG